MRKARKNLNNKEIERVFMRHPSPSGIVAVFMYRKCEKNIVNVMKMNEKSLDETSQTVNQTDAKNYQAINEHNDDAVDYGDS
jgi:hypothetical protein